MIGREHPTCLRLEDVAISKSDTDFITDACYRSLFADKGRTLFCGQNSQSCAAKFGRVKGSCLNEDPSRCRDSRPDVIILFYQAPDSYRIGGRAGRYSLTVRCPETLFGKDGKLANFCLEQIDIVEDSKPWTHFNNKDTRKYLLLPHRNFKNRERDKQVNGMISPNGLAVYISKLKDVFRRSGQKLVDERELEFKEDQPHRFPSSGVAKQDWLNAHYRYGFPFDNRYHYDVTEKDDAKVKNLAMLDILSGSSQTYSATHLNIFPNDEVQIQE